MERSSLDSQGYKLESQLREAFGRVVYTQTCHDKIVKRYLTYDENIKIGQIVLSALTTGSFLMIILGEEGAAFGGAILSTVLLIINTLSKNFKFVEMSKEHQVAADKLWKIREEYVSLLTDFELLDVSEVMKKRDELQDRTYQVYSNSPRTDAKSYKQSQKALKTEEEQTFSDDEIDVMLPNSIRRSNRNINS